MTAEPTLTAACAECLETTVPAIPGALPSSSIVRRFRAVDGRLRVDFGNFSMLTDPATGERIILDHIALEARVLANAATMPAAELSVHMPTVPSAPGGPAVPNVVALGVSMIDGLEVEGMRHVFPVLDALQPPPILSWEVWTSTKLQMPVVSTTVGSFGVRTCVCRCVAVAPPESAFQIPTGYNVVR